MLPCHWDGQSAKEKDGTYLYASQNPSAHMLAFLALPRYSRQGESTASASASDLGNYAATSLIACLPICSGDGAAELKPPEPLPQDLPSAAHERELHAINTGGRPCLLLPLWLNLAYKISTEAPTAYHWQDCYHAIPKTVFLRACASQGV
jgi:hypothetical protein